MEWLPWSVLFISIAGYHSWKLWLEHKEKLAGVKQNQKGEK
jgi:hypothetical protein